MSAASQASSCPTSGLERYRDWRSPFHQAAEGMLEPGVRILDVGSGRRPILPLDRRPPGCVYVGLDMSASELETAPAGSYDAVHVADVTEHLPALDAQYDLILSWQVLEHVKPLPLALSNIRSYLRPRGIFVGQLSGAFSVFGLLNQCIPHRLAQASMKWLLRRDPETVFPAYYHRCWQTALEAESDAWTKFTVVPRHGGAVYFSFSAHLQRCYLAYEEWTIRSDRHNLATHYLLIGEK